MNKRQLLQTLARSAAALLALKAALAQDGAWPTRPIRLIVPFPAGGGTDIVARALGQKLSERLGQPVVIDNRPGASTIIGTDAVVKAAPDGHTLLVSGSSSFTVNPALRARLPYDPLRDLAPLAIVAQAPLVLVVRQGADWQTVDQLLAAARHRPRGIRYASYGAGSATHLSGELLALAANVKLQQVPYQGSAQALLAVIGGEIELGMDTVAAAAPHIRAGRLRPLGIMGNTHSSLLPEVRTLAEQGLPEAVFDAWYGIAAPAHTPPALLRRLTRDVGEVMADPALQQRLRALGLEPIHLDGPAFEAQMRAEIARYRQAALRAGIVPE